MMILLFAFLTFATLCIADNLLNQDKNPWP
jgi:hypothetical protein